MASDHFGEFDLSPAVDFDLDLPESTGPHVGGWISVGYGQGRLGQ